MLGWQLSRLYPAQSSWCLTSIQTARQEVRLLGGDWEGDRGRGITLVRRRNTSLHPRPLRDEKGMVLTLNHHPNWVALAFHCFPLFFRTLKTRLPHCPRINGRGGGSFQVSEICFVTLSLDPQRLPGPFLSAAGQGFCLQPWSPQLGWEMGVAGHRHRSLSPVRLSGWQ